MKKYSRYVRKQCMECGVLEGDFHKYGCHFEKCPFCGEYLMGCECSLHILQNRLNRKDIDDQWLEILTIAGRVPFIYYPMICARCGKIEPEIFTVPDEEWQYYVEPYFRDKYLCKGCYAIVKELIDLKSKKYLIFADNI